MSKNLKILLASPRGFCAGVDRAIEIVKIALVKFGSPVYVRHEIVHNTQVVENLRKLGAIFVEELDELEQAMKTKNLTEVADALTDILYVTYGAGCAYGINLDKCFKEVQRANMSKLGKDGKPIFNDKGKVMKGPNYIEPNLKQFVE